MRDTSSWPILPGRDVPVEVDNCENYNVILFDPVEDTVRKSVNESPSHAPIEWLIQQRVL